MLRTQAQDPYLGYQQPSAKCPPLLSASAPMIDDFFVQQGGNEKDLAMAVAVQPVMVAIRVESSFYLYSGGVYTTPTTGTVQNHGVAVVGYGTDAATGLPFWLIKNSWGKGWGIGGFMKLQRNVPSSPFGIIMQTQYMFYPLVYGWNSVGLPGGGRGDGRGAVFVCDHS